MNVIIFRFRTPKCISYGNNVLHWIGLHCFCVVRKKALHYIQSQKYKCNNGTECPVVWMCVCGEVHVNKSNYKWNKFSLLNFTLGNAVNTKKCLHSHSYLISVSNDSLGQWNRKNIPFLSPGINDITESHWKNNTCTKLNGYTHCRTMQKKTT